MKKLLFLIALVAITFAANAQHSTSRIGATGCTGGALNFYYKAYTTPASTRRITPNSFNYILKDTLNASRTDSIVIVNAYAGDQLTIIYNNRATADTVTFGGSFSGAAGGYPASGANTTLTNNKLPIPASKVATIRFIFDGALWREISHSINL